MVIINRINYLFICRYSSTIPSKNIPVRSIYSLVRSGNSILEMEGTDFLKNNKPSGPERSYATLSGDNKTTDPNFGFGEAKPIDERGFLQFLAGIQKARASCGQSLEWYEYNERRAKCINGLSARPNGQHKGVCYWMFRDQRIDDNWALIWAQRYALRNKCPLYVTFFLMSHYSVAGTRQYDFMLRGLQQLEKQCRNLGIQFHLELGYAKDIIDAYCERHKIDLVVADFCPLRDPMSWVQEAGHKLVKKSIPLYVVDAHNIVPTWIASDEQESLAFTIRPKIQKHLKTYLTEIPALQKHPHQPEKVAEAADWDGAWCSLNIDQSVKPVGWAKPGTMNGYRMLYQFITQRLERYSEERNIPTKHSLSCLSPYYHFGQLSIQRAILCVTEKDLRLKSPKSVDEYFEQTIIRRELSDNFCYYNPNYDNINGAPDWARKSLKEHEKDRREHLYTLEQFQFAKTHDKLWNAAQIQLLQEGKMHGYFRMYWAKKILEWTPNVEEALRIAIFLNDKYELDGRDPNGYALIMWSIAGALDRPFAPDRKVVGKIRWMSYHACARKFDSDFYAKTYSQVPN